MHQNQVIVITGTSSGFGRLIALTAAQKGHQVFATMRSTTGKNAAACAELTSLGKGHIHVVDLDVCSDESVDNAVSSILAQAGHIDVLVNNAGFAIMGLAETVSDAQATAQFDTNVMGPHRTMRAVLPSMRARGRGLIIQITSGLGRMVLPMMGVYCASKFALEALSEAYRYELKPTGVEVSIVQPGAFPTELPQHMVVGTNQERAAGYGPLADGMQQMGKSFETMFAHNPPSPQLVADGVMSLIDMQPGQRPARLVVDPMTGQIVRDINDAIAEKQRGALQGMHMGMLAD
ncbi:MAG TPA: SDR family oxidoreductase [Pseudomonadota bacterium]|nr:SDR family oxidoreductase [Pseudomonadota bacterium]